MGKNVNLHICTPTKTKTDIFCIFALAFLHFCRFQHCWDSVMDPYPTVSILCKNFRWCDLIEKALIKKRGEETVFEKINVVVSRKYNCKQSNFLCFAMYLCQKNLVQLINLKYCYNWVKWPLLHIYCVYAVEIADCKAKSFCIHIKRVSVFSSRELTYILIKVTTEQA